MKDIFIRDALLFEIGLKKAVNDEERLKVRCAIVQPGSGGHAAVTSQSSTSTTTTTTTSEPARPKPAVSQSGIGLREAESNQLQMIREMNAINPTLHEVPGVRLPLQTNYASPPHAFFMYSTGSDGVTLQLRDTDEFDEKNSLASVLARLQQDDNALSISYQDTEMLNESNADVLFGANSSLNPPGNNGNSSSFFDLFDSDTIQDLNLSPTLASTAECFLNDNSDSLGLSADTGTAAGMEESKVTPDSSKLSLKKARPKALSPSRQGPQHCQVCGKIFGNASALAKHKLTHSDERKYVCTMCGKAFKRQDHLNGHMLTHRNKKPYECKAEGCGKSYCDARSLRRHTENHHAGSNANSTSTNREAAPPLSPSCIQFAPPPTQSLTQLTTSCPKTTVTSTHSRAPSQLQRLLAVDCGTLASASNDGLTKQQLDLIHQIMQQAQPTLATPKQTHKTASSSAGSSSGLTSKSSTSTKTKSWTMQSPAAGGSKSSSSSHHCAPSTSGSTSKSTTDPKAVECNLCHRKFKNIPALNGHMRLHGGYFKKESDPKKCEKKEASGPPLQTASMSVRALIEEKIIQKRITNPQNAVGLSSETTTVKSIPSPLLSSTSTSLDPDLNIKLSSFVVPAPPLPAMPLPTEKNRRHSDSEHFFGPRTPSATSQEPQTLAELLFKRGKKIAVKRASSDPGARLDTSSPLQLGTSNSPGPPLQLNFQPMDYSLNGLAYQSDDAALFSSSIPEDVFQQVSADAMLLQGVDPNQLAESLQFQASLLGDQTDQLPLEDYTDANSQDIQAVLNSTLPPGLADFATFGASQTDSPKDLPYQDSPLQPSKDFINFVNSPHPSMATQSPLPSPIMQNDSPSFTYPTPPASQEGQSPSFSQSILSNSLRMSSPSQSVDSFAQPTLSSSVGPIPVSSPLSAAFYPSTMSSAAAVEAALSEVLPLDTQSNSSSSGRLGIYQTTPPPISPFSGIPIPSPLSMPNFSASCSTVSSPLPQTPLGTPEVNSGFPLLLQQPLQSQMMPNSDDPLLSSCPKDFANRERFDFNGVRSFKLIGNGVVDLGNGGLGIMVDTNGELKIFQTATPQQAKHLLMSGAAIINTSNGAFIRKVEAGTTFRLIGKNATLQNVTSTGGRNQRTKIQISLENVKEEFQDDLFLSTSSISSTPSTSGRMNSTNTETVTSYVNLNPQYQSRLRIPTSRESVTPLPFTPAPILSPSRPGQGLYWQMAASASSLWPTSTTLNTTSNGANENNDFMDVSVESAENPRINIGSEFQATIPDLETNRSKADRDPCYEHLLWDPGIAKVCTDSEIEMYLEFACCAAVPGGGRNKEYALHLLNMCQGNIHEAMLKLMQPTPWLPPGHPLLAYEYAESDRWSADEVDAFHQGLLKYDKDFRTIAHEIGSKTVKQCVQFYYLWKKICPEEYKRLRLLRRRKECGTFIKSEVDLGYEEIKIEPDIRFPSPVNDVDLVSTSSESRLFVCEYPDCSASFNSRAALSGHIRIHGGTAGGRAPTPDRRAGPSVGESVDEFPCKICGKIFSKVKSRSAHMKSHRPPDAESKRPRLDPHKMDTSEPGTGRGAGASTSSGPSVSRMA